MTSPTADSRTWPRHRWAAMIVLIFAGQAGFIFWLSARKNEQLPASPSLAGPVIYFPANQTTELPGVSDPTLFVLPGVHSFSGPAWMQFSPATYQPGKWTEPPRPLPLAILQLGATLTEYVRTNQPRPFELALAPEPDVDPIGYLPLDESQSTVSIEGALADRGLLVPLQPESRPAAEILTNTEVQVAVDAAGHVFSAVLLGKSASADANASALKLARSARFEPLRWLGVKPPAPAPDGLSWGTMVFHWRTIAPPAPATPSTK
jgi:hypothetical protein